MSQRFWSWYEGVLASVRDVLKPFGVIDRGTGSDTKLRAFYLIDRGTTGKSRNRGFVVHLAPRYTLNKINICLGSSENSLRIPPQCPALRPGYGKNQCQFDIYLGHSYAHVLDLAAQVAESKSRDLMAE